MPFADTLAAGLIARAQAKFADDPLYLSSIRLLLPTRRACRAMKEAFLRQGEGKLMLLPMIEPIGDPDEDELAIFETGLAGSDGLGGDLDIPPAMPPLRRLALLTDLVIKHEGFEGSYAQALSLAKALGQLLDQVQTEDLTLDNLDSLVPENFAVHWQKSLSFLNMLREQWPEIVKREGRMDSVARRSLLMHRRAKQWLENPPQGPVIAAGITGSVPASAALLRAVLDLPQGEIVLAGLDQMMDEEIWQSLEDNHPHYTHKKVLERLEISRTEIAIWPEALKVKRFENGQAREQIMSQVMLPAEYTQNWRQPADKALLDRALEGLSLTEFETGLEEAAGIALMMREVLEDENRRKTAALVTPDRNLAAQVKGYLLRWGVNVDDSAGEPLRKTKRGEYLLQLLNVFQENLRATPFMALLKQSLCGDGLVPNLRKEVRRLDRLLRGAPQLGSVEEYDGFLRRNKGQDLADKLSPLFDALRPMQEQVKARQDLDSWIVLHLSVAEALAATTEKSGAERLWGEEAGEALTGLFSDMRQQSKSFALMSLDDYAQLLDMVMAEISLRVPYGQHPRLRILGLMESRLHHSDLMILGGLNEGVWPKEAEADPWMSRPMRASFGLPSPEQKTGFAAHDFVQGFCAKQVHLTRAKKQGADLSLPSRFLQRLDTYLKAQGYALKNCKSHLDYAKITTTLDIYDGAPAPFKRPFFAPPLAVRPQSMSVTNIETWLADPYSIYAKYILNLRALDTLEKPIDDARRGQLIHTLLHRYMKCVISGEVCSDVQNIKAKLYLIFDEICAEEGLHNSRAQNWWPRFEEAVQWFAQQEALRLQKGVQKPLFLEQEGRAVLYKNDSTKRSFEVTAKADRIDQAQDHSVIVMDYKSGKADTHLKKIKKGTSVQLPLTGYILQAGGFDDTAFEVADLQYWQLSGGHKDPCAIFNVPTEKGETLNDLIIEMRDYVRSLIEVFEDEQTPYISVPDPDREPPEAFQDYAHLARLREWRNEDESGEGGQS